MKTLIAEDDFTSRLLLQLLLKNYGLPHLAANGQEAVEAVRIALEAGHPYDLICLDIMMPEEDGLEALREIRALEEASGLTASATAKIIMTSSLADKDAVIKARDQGCDHYLLKPIQQAKLREELRRLRLIP